MGRERHFYSYTGSLHELLVYDRQLTMEEIFDVEAYLHSRWFAPILVTLAITQARETGINVTGTMLDGSELFNCAVPEETTIDFIRAQAKSAASSTSGAIQLMVE